MRAPVARRPKRRSQAGKLMPSIAALSVAGWEATGTGAAPRAGRSAAVAASATVGAPPVDPPRARTSTTARAAATPPAIARPSRGGHRTHGLRRGPRESRIDSTWARSEAGALTSAAVARMSAPTSSGDWGSVGIMPTP